jgi:type IV secretion system protein VirB8
MSADRALDAYFAEAASWERDRVEAARKMTRLLAWGAGLGWTAAALSACALIALVPLKTVEPFVIRVDNTTGVIDVVPRHDATAPPSELVTRYLLTHYVQVCERFNYATAEADYEECAAFHTPQRNAVWAAKWARSNPESPLNVYKDGATVRAQVSSISFITRSDGSRDLAQVRYSTVRRLAEGGAETVTPWVATLRFAYVEPSKDPAIRRWNPLGFRIVDFHPEPETPPKAAPAPPAAAPVVAAAGERP